ncbi:hypothetical protein M011DRAFT_466151 [Sporormia fimetaria CBS 119925]|uniref:Uncharacterized protein n=1 Tax=Sporormia fimetaria CBS 119925 TaxID=1340428 RepID=A0A6A6VH50_9PLEO|nr:hypothetical protein M011DRAFT_466151 [Sporormia fimetaria CBS 119925]
MRRPVSCGLGSFVSSCIIATPSSSVQPVREFFFIQSTTDQEAYHRTTLQLARPW